MVHHDSGSMSAGDRFERIEETLIAHERDCTIAHEKLWVEINEMKKEHALLDKMVAMGQLKVSIYLGVAFFALSLFANWLMKRL